MALIRLLIALLTFIGVLGECFGISYDSGYDAAQSIFAGRSTTGLLGAKPGAQENQQADSQLFAKQ